MKGIIIIILVLIILGLYFYPEITKSVIKATGTATANVVKKIGAEVKDSETIKNAEESLSEKVHNITKAEKEADG